MGTYEHYYLINQIDTMKKLLHIIAVIAVLCCACGKEYDDSELRNAVSSLEQRISAMETVMSAYKNKLLISSVSKTEDGYVIVFSDGSKAVVTNGRDGADGETLIESVVVEEDDVCFVLTDGRKFSIPLLSSISISFNDSDLVVMDVNSTRMLRYEIKSNICDVNVDVVSSPDIKAKVVRDKDSKLSGYIEVKTGDIIDEYSKVIVFVSNGEKLIMRSITFEKVGLVIDDNAEKNIVAKGGEITLEFLSNVKCDVVIPDDAKSWISVVPETRGLTKQSIKLKIEANTEYNRTSIVTVRSKDGVLSLDYTIAQIGLFGAKINPAEVPDDEIWYTTSTGRKIVPNSGCYFGAEMISNEYRNELGIMKFNGPVTAISDKAFENFITENCIHLRSMALPSKVERIGSAAFYRCENLVDISLPNSLKGIGEQAFMSTSLTEISIPDSVESFGNSIMMCCSALKRINSKFSSEDGKCLIIDGTLNSFASYGLTEYDLPDDITIVGYGVFSGKESLQRVGLPHGLKKIEKLAFEYMGLKKVVIPEGVTEIGDWAFRGNKYLESIHFPNTLISLGQTIVGMSPNLKEITGKFSSSDNKAIIVDGEIITVAPYELRNYTIPEGVHTIGEDLFWDNNLIESITVSEGVKKIKRAAFFGCDNLHTIHFPSTLESIGDRILSGCKNLERISGAFASEDGRCLIKDGKLEGFAPEGLTRYSIPDNVKEIRGSVFDCVELNEIIIPEGVEIIAADTFRICNNLTSITFPSTIKSIGDYAGGDNILFYGCSALSKIVCKADTPPKLSVPLKISCPVYVPQNSIDLYKKHRQWRKYKIVAMTSDNDLYESTDYSQDGKTFVLQSATNGRYAMNIVLLGDGYSDRQISDGTYKADMESAYRHFFLVEPYRTFRNFFNVRYVNVVSKNEGYGPYNETALGGYFGNGTRVGGNDDKCFEYAPRKSDDDLMIVVMNSENYGGTCYMYHFGPTKNDYGIGVSIAYCPKGDSEATFASIIKHEACGHGFAKLGDEYAYENMGIIPEEEVNTKLVQYEDWGWWKNVDFTNDLSAVRWSRFISDSRYADEGLGAFEGGLTYWSGVWRPTENSIMSHNTGGFNAPSREAIYYRIHKLAYGDSWEYDYEDFVKYDEINRKASSSAHWNAFNPENYRPLHPPVVVGKSWKDVTHE